jgi:hypothetical protein
VLATIGIIVAVTSGAFTKEIAAGNKVTTPDGKTSVLVSDNPFETEQREPLLVYNACDTELLTDEGQTNQQARVTCNTSDITGTLPENKDASTRLDYYRFSAPSKLVNSGLLYFNCDSRLFVYADNYYEIELEDEAGAKRYPVRLYELPQ